MSLTGNCDINLVPVGRVVQPAAVRSPIAWPALALATRQQLRSHGAREQAAQPFAAKFPYLVKHNLRVREASDWFNDNGPQATLNAVNFAARDGTLATHGRQFLRTSEPSGQAPERGSGLPQDANRVPLYGKTTPRLSSLHPFAHLCHPWQEGLRAVFEGWEINTIITLQVRNTGDRWMREPMPGRPLPVSPPGEQPDLMEFFWETISFELVLMDF